MYSHHHYNYDEMSHGNTNAHPLGRPASMPSLCQTLSSDVENNKSHHRTSLDYNAYQPSTYVTTAGNWQDVNHNNNASWNHNHHDNPLPSSSSPPLSVPASGSPLSVPINTNSVTAGFTNYPSTGSSNYLYNLNSSIPQARHNLTARPKLTTTLWEDEATICYQVDANGICVARRRDNDMINGTKLLNVAGMSRGKRDGILKNEKGRVVVKVGAMHLKGVWITFTRAKLLAAQYKIQDILYPLFVDNPNIFLPTTALYSPTRLNTFRSQNAQNYVWERQTTNLPNESSSFQSVCRNTNYSSTVLNHTTNNDDMFLLSSQVNYDHTNTTGRSGGLIGCVYTDKKSRIYLPDKFVDSKDTVSTDPTFFGHKNMSSGTPTLSSPTSSEAGKSSIYHTSRQSGEFESFGNERRQSLAMPTPSRVSSPRHHPYMSPGKGFASATISSFQAFKHSGSHDDTDYNIQNDTLGNHKHPW
ncbi:hypothetical protein BD560DRAFT_381035 [Blakeslea trispora]|nr:hypothetical protein BD560DRAFT_381035 [Blakeslea trispora]